MDELRAVVANLEDVPEAVRGFYREDGERFVLRVEPAEGFALEDVQGLKTSLVRERERRKGASSLLTGLGFQFDEDANAWEGGIDGDEYKRMKEQLQEFESIDLDRDPDKIASEKFKAIERQHTERWQREIKKREDRAARLLDELKREKILTRAVHAIREAGGSERLLLPILEREADMREEGDEFQVMLLDEKGDPRVSSGNGDLWMTFDERLEQLREMEDCKPAFLGRQRPGAGTSTSAANAAAQSAPTGATIARTDSEALGDSLADIAAGKVGVAF